MPDDADTEELLADYRRTLLSMHAVDVGSAGTPQVWNRLVDQMQRVHLLLRETEAGRVGISDLLSDDCVTVRAWSATNALAWDPARSRAELERLAAEDQRLNGFNAKITLREFDAGRLKTDWVP